MVLPFYDYNAAVKRIKYEGCKIAFLYTLKSLVRYMVYFSREYMWKKKLSIASWKFLHLGKEESLNSDEVTQSIV